MTMRKKSSHHSTLMDRNETDGEDGGGGSGASKEPRAGRHFEPIGVGRSDTLTFDL